MPAQAVHHRLVDPDQEVERPDLAAVRVPRHLQVDAGRRGLPDELRLVRDQQHGPVLVRVGQRAHQVRPVPGKPGGLGGHVVHPGQDEGVPAAFDHHMAVVQRLPAQLRHPVQPALRLAEVLVVAGDVDLRQPRPDRPERCGLLAAAGRGAVGDVARVDDDVRVERVDRLGDPGRPARPVDRPVVRVGQHHDPRPVEALAEPRDPHVEPLHPRQAHRLVVPPGQQHGRDGGDPHGDAPGPVRTADAEPDQHQVQQAAEHRPAEQHPHHPEGGVRDPGRAVVLPPVPGEHQEGEGDQRAPEDGGAGHEHRQRPPGARPEQRPPRQHEQQREHEQDDPDPSPPRPPCPPLLLDPGLHDLPVHHSPTPRSDAPIIRLLPARRCRGRGRSTPAEKTEVGLVLLTDWARARFGTYQLRPEMHPHHFSPRDFHALCEMGGFRLGTHARDRGCGPRHGPRGQRRGDQRLLRGPLRRHVEQPGRPARPGHHRARAQGLHGGLRARQRLQPDMGRHPPHRQRLLHRPADREGEVRGRLAHHLLRRRERAAAGLDVFQPEPDRRRLPGADQRLRRHAAGLRHRGRRHRGHRRRRTPDAGDEGPQGVQPRPHVLGDPAGADQRPDQRRREHHQGRQDGGRQDRRGQHHDHGLLRGHRHPDGPGLGLRRPGDAGADAVRRLGLRLRQPRDHPDDRQERRRFDLHAGRRPDRGDLRRAARRRTAGLLGGHPRPGVRRRRQLAAHVQPDQPEPAAVHRHLHEVRGRLRGNQRRYDHRRHHHRGYDDDRRHHDDRRDHRRLHLHHRLVELVGDLHRRQHRLVEGPQLEGQVVDAGRGARHHRRVGRLAGPRRLLTRRPHGPRT
ncbi:hypothetical protein SBRY_30980 [Actinacidiphila bryophytorum]|uniref:Uncharacterized protein n=1 Tax=Actinacidiphila bryophytorum TaxID=1436133 RepID=A0A9W4MHK6_9ACTN|nr:hypothetical protein SBRY_30980 [Actinacidiphila bryophytorum]